jgi:hypothetical protein
MRTALVAGGSFNPFYVCHDDDEYLSRAAARTLPHSGPSALIADRDLQILLLVITASSVDCYGSAKLNIRPATESTLVLFASAGGATSKWVSSPKPLSASEI